MNLNCPYCGETIPYDRSIAGRSVACSYCENAIQMPLVEALPEELQEELLHEEAKQQKKLKRKYSRKQEEYLKEVEKEEVEKRQQQEALRRQQEMERTVEAARRPVAEEMGVGKRYRALRVLAQWNMVILGLILLGYALTVVMLYLGMARLVGVVPPLLVAGAAIFFAIPTAFFMLIVWAGGEIIRVFLDIADDVRMARLLIKKQVYRRTDT
jgi:hypothetical protein